MVSSPYFTRRRNLSEREVELVTRWHRTTGNFTCEELMWLRYILRMIIRDRAINAPLPRHAAETSYKRLKATTFAMLYSAPARPADVEQASMMADRTVRIHTGNFEDGKVDAAGYALGGTATGRISNSGPNYQSIFKDRSLKEWLADVDFAKLETRFASTMKTVADRGFKIDHNKIPLPPGCYNAKVDDVSIDIETGYPTFTITGVKPMSKKSKTLPKSKTEKPTSAQKLLAYWPVSQYDSTFSGPYLNKERKRAIEKLAKNKPFDLAAELLVTRSTLAGAQEESQGRHREIQTLREEHRKVIDTLVHDRNKAVDDMMRQRDKAQADQSETRAQLIAAESNLQRALAYIQHLEGRLVGERIDPNRDPFIADNFADVRSMTHNMRAKGRSRPDVGCNNGSIRSRY